MGNDQWLARSSFDLLRTPPRAALANFYPFARGEQAGGHWSESNLFLPVTHGHGRIQVGPHWFELQAGQVLQVPWAAPIFYQADRLDPFVVIGLHFTYLPWPASPVGRPLHTRRETNFALSSMQAPPSPQPFGAPFVLAPPPDSRIFELGAAIAYAFEHAADDEPGNREALLRGLALAFLAEFMRLSRGARPAHRGSVASAAQMRVVREMASYMELSLDRSLRRGELAERAGLSESALAEAFRAVTGRGPIDYLIDVRLAHAKRLLRTSRERIGAIAARVGIPDVYHFSKLFKKRAGCSPLEYRKRLRL